MEKGNENVDVVDCLRIMTDAMVGFTDAMKQLIESIGHLRKAVSLMGDQIDSLEKEDG